MNEIICCCFEEDVGVGDAAATLPSIEVNVQVGQRRHASSPTQRCRAVTECDVAATAAGGGWLVGWLVSTNATLHNRIKWGIGGGLSGHVIKMELNCPYRTGWFVRNKWGVLIADSSTSSAQFLFSAATLSSFPAAAALPICRIVREGGGLLICIRQKICIIAGNN